MIQVISYNIIFILKWGRVMGLKVYKGESYLRAILFIMNNFSFSYGCNATAA